MYEFDLCVIGSGPAGQKCAVQAAKFGKRVCVVERREVVGGVAINTGTIPSKALREAVLHLTGFEHREMYGSAYAVKKDITIEDLTFWCQHVIRGEIDVVRSQLLRNDVRILTGTGSLAGPHRVHLRHGTEEEEITAEHIFIATGTRPARPDAIPFDREHIVDADGLLGLPRLPRTLLVVGGGVIGTEYASMMQAMGVKVTLVEARDHILGFLDREIREALQYHLRQSGMTLRLGEHVEKVELRDAPPGVHTQTGKLVEAFLESDKILRADAMLYAIGREGCTAGLQLDRVGATADHRGRLKVNEHYQVVLDDESVGPIYAGGDVIGFPALASTSMEQGRLAACHMFGMPHGSYAELLPYGIYSIPEISTIGWTEEELTEKDIPFETGIANYREIARGKLLGDQIGMLKLLVHQETRHILGVHCIGTGATEIIHIGQAVMGLRGTVDYFINTVFNFPTLAECYKVAALNAANKLSHAYA